MWRSAPRAPGDVVGDDGLEAAHDLELRRVAAGALGATADVLQHARHGLDRHEVQDDAVGDLARQLEHRRHERGEVDRHRLRAAATRAGSRACGSCVPAKVTRSPASIWRSTATVSRMRVSGRSNGTPPHASTIVSLDAPMPSTTRPGASCATEPAPAAMTDGVRV